MNKDGSSPPVLILGSTGGFGGAVANEFLRQERSVRLFVRDVTGARDRFGSNPRVEYVQGDVLDEESLREAVKGCWSVVHGVNFPYSEWNPKLMHATRNVLNAVSEETRVLLFPGNVYGLGAQTDEPLTEDREPAPTTEKGRLRVDLESTLRTASGNEGLSVVILRAGDFFGPTVRNPLVDSLFGRAVRGRSLWVLGDLDQPHQWAYAPDLARVGVDLLDRESELGDFEVFHFGGYVASSQRKFLRNVIEATGRPDLKIRKIPWYFVRMIGWFQPEARELLELRYLFDDGVVLDDRKLRGFFPGLELTPQDEAIKRTLKSYG